jgi:hypothetical protein
MEHSCRIDTQCPSCREQRRRNRNARKKADRAEMTGGFAFIAYPEKYGDTGIATFITNQNGIVYEKDLGKSTTETATAVTEFNPDKTWRVEPE